MKMPLGGFALDQAVLWLAYRTTRPGLPEGDGEDAGLKEAKRISHVRLVRVRES